MSFEGLIRLQKSYNPTTKKKNIKICECGVGYIGAGKTCKPCAYDRQAERNRSANRYEYNREYMRKRKLQ